MDACIHFHYFFNYARLLGIMEKMNFDVLLSNAKQMNFGIKCLDTIYQLLVFVCCTWHELDINGVDFLLMMCQVS